jgi:hypothetical protein
LKPKLLTTKSNTSLRLEPSSPSPSFWPESKFT